MKVTTTPFESTYLPKKLLLDFGGVSINGGNNSDTLSVRASVKRVGSFKTLIKDLVPEDTLKLIPRSYDIVGDIALINLPKEVLSYGWLVGNAILTLNKNVRAVYAVGITVGDFRVRELIHIAGEEKTSTIHKEYGIKIYVDLKNAYFNPSLSEEHRRIANKVVDGESILDLFTGVGPFTLHILCSRKAYVLANDLNYYATECLRKSLELNRKSVKGVVDIVNSDASELLNSIKSEFFDKAILNLPHKSTYYLGRTLNAIKRGGTVYTYVVAKTKLEALNEVLNAITTQKYEVCEPVRVLDYAPHKYIFRVEITKK